MRVTTPLKQRGLTLVEIVVVILVIAVLAAIAVPSMIRARQRKMASTVLNEARMLDAAKSSYGLENNKSGTTAPAFADLTPYLKAGGHLSTHGGKDSLGYNVILGSYVAPLRINPATQTALTAVADTTFWGPYS